MIYNPSTHPTFTYEAKLLHLYLQQTMHVLPLDNPFNYKLVQIIKVLPCPPERSNSDLHVSVLTLRSANGGECNPFHIYCISKH